MTPPRINLPSGVCACLNPNCDIPYGTCHCRCGGKTSIAKATEVKKGVYIGRPKQWLTGHCNIKRVPIENAEPFKIEGEYCRLIPLTQGQYAIVSAVDYLWLMQWKWYAVWGKTTASFYAVRTVWRDGKQDSVFMHRQILGLLVGDKTWGDHKDRLNTTDNRRGNLRGADSTESHGNIGIPAHNTSGFKGVSFAKTRGRWLAQIQYRGQHYFLGYYDTPEEAHRAYQSAALRLFGDFACFG